jgi:hypothetical protein
MGYDSRAAPGEKSTIPTTPESEMIMYEFANGCTGKEKYTLLLFQSSGKKNQKKTFIAYSHSTHLGHRAENKVLHGVAGELLLIYI